MYRGDPADQDIVYRARFTGMFGSRDQAPPADES
jgi:hypothetical protein